MASKKNVGLILAILFATVAISGSMVFLGLQMKGGNGQNNLSEATLAKKIEEGILSFIQKTNEEQQKAQEKDQGEQTKVILPAKDVKPVSADYDHIKGKSKAPFSIVEYSDFECPYCQQLHQAKTLEKLQAAYGDKVNIVYRHFPLNFHNPVATDEAEASECVAELGGNEKFWEYMELIYERTGSNKLGIQDGTVTTLAKEVGVNEKKFTDCINSDRHLARIQKDIEEGSNSGVGSTPSAILLNNATGQAVLIRGGQSLSVFKQEFDKLMEGK